MVFCSQWAAIICSVGVSQGTSNPYTNVLISVVPPFSTN